MGDKEGWLLVQGTWPLGLWLKCQEKGSPWRSNTMWQPPENGELQTTSETRNFRISKNYLCRGMPSFSSVCSKQWKEERKPHHKFITKFILSGSCLQPEWYISQSIKNRAPTTDFALISNMNLSWFSSLLLSPSSSLSLSFSLLPTYCPIPNLANGLQTQTLWHPKQAHKSEMSVDRILRTSHALWGANMSFYQLRTRF